jgi:ABC-type transport system involved in cytochrome c biogenesis permease subunit
MMMSYTLFGLVAFNGIMGVAVPSAEARERLRDVSLVVLYPAVFLLTFGTFLGAVWANISWGTYWAWDPKETWAAITWLTYLLYVHYRISRPKDHQTAMWILILAFICLQICWWGINYLPSAHATSVHVY